MDEDHDDDDDDDVDDHNDNDDNDDDDDDGKKGMSNTVSHWLLDTVSNVHLFSLLYFFASWTTGQDTRCTVSNVQLATYFSLHCITTLPACLFVTKSLNGGSNKLARVSC